MRKTFWVIERGMLTAGFPGSDRGLCWVSDLDKRCLRFNSKSLANEFVNHNKLTKVEVRRRSWTIRDGEPPVLRSWEGVPETVQVSEPRSIYQAWYPDMASSQPDPQKPQ